MCRITESKVSGKHLNDVATHPPTVSIKSLGRREAGGGEFS